ncbi:hypothetical protein K490DRAFT_44602 [Saccharata proteae CBS 121410]|uniref:T6SS Phospholipase effector Tle1-like catalytic domain-containing protein n=1 Tax=Saccharata proteae CBS 121410 TaxID=1314787 RepID=A0A9P4HR04_9PEZI|nr:hypothetical protein K490DRAFT_44602 [Saccharata proteae CBS 121410]
MDSDNGYVYPTFWDPQGHLQTPSNVTRIGRAILTEDKNHHPQIVYYQAGVGTGFSLSDKLIGGGTGEGLGENIREAYSFLANNYTPGDSIFLIGFSRGAFTARSIAGLIGAMGLLEKSGLPFFYDVFKDWENTGLENYKPMIKDQIPDFGLTVTPDKKDEYLDQYLAELKKRDLTRTVEIKAIGVWDTVGALGIPTTPFLRALNFPDFLHTYKFFDTSLDNHIENAFQALALDERRSAYGPAVWQRRPGCTTNLKQTWFPGVHSNVGGSYDDAELANLTLAWMMSQLSPWIEFDDEYVGKQWLINQKYYAKHVQTRRRGWALGRLVDSLKFPMSLLGMHVRTPGRYRRTDWITGRETGDLLVDTEERVHASVRVRMEDGGAGFNDRGRYKPAALKDWKCVEKEGYSDDVERDVDEVRWVYYGNDQKCKGKILPEDELGRFEMELLKKDPEAAARMFGEDWRVKLAGCGGDGQIDVRA